jgi:hypothetical protein
VEYDVRVRLTDLARNRRINWDLLSSVIVARRFLGEIVEVTRATCIYSR